MKAYGGVDVWIHMFLIPAVVGAEWSALLPGVRARDNRFIGGSDDVEKRKLFTIAGLELLPLCPKSP
jgi:hypothetical protein